MPKSLREVEKQDQRPEKWPDVTKREWYYSDLHTFMHTRKPPEKRRKVTRKRKRLMRLEPLEEPRLQIGRLPIRRVKICNFIRIGRKTEE